MAKDITINIVSRLNPTGFSDAEKEMRNIEQMYQESTGKVLKTSSGSIAQLKKNITALLTSDKEGGAALAKSYVENWVKGMTFSGQDINRISANINKALSEVQNVDSGLFKSLDMSSIMSQLNEVSGVYESTVSKVTETTNRETEAHQAKLAVYDQLGLKTEYYTEQMRFAQAEMERLAVSSGDNSARMKELATQYSNAKTELEQMNQTGSKTSNWLTYFSATLTSMATHMAFSAVIRGIKSTLRESAQAAAEAEQKFNKLSTVFDGFGDSAKKAAAQLANSIGVATSTASSALSTVGDLLQARGMDVAQSLEVANDWVSQFQDIIAFKDIDMSLEEFANSFMAGVAGNTRNFRTFGSIVKETDVKMRLAKEGLDGLTGSQLELQKAIIRGNIALEQQANAVGATQREWNSTLSINRRLSEEWKQYKEALGENINAIFSPIKQWWTDILAEANKARKVEKEYKEGALESNVYDLENPKDLQRYKSELYEIMDTLYWNSQADYFGNVDLALQENEEFYMDEFKKLMFKYSVSYERLVKDLEELQNTYKDPDNGYNLTIPLNENIKEQLKQLDENTKKAIEIKKSIEKLTSTYETILNLNNQLYESIGMLSGVTDFISPIEDSDLLPTIKNSKYSEQYKQLMLKEFEQSALLAVKDVLTILKDNMENNAKAFVSEIDYELGKISESDLLAAPIDSLEQLYEIVKNSFLLNTITGENGERITTEEQALLDEILQALKTANDNLNTYNKKQEILKDLTSSITNTQKEIAQRAGIQGYVDSGYSEKAAELLYQRDLEIESLRESFATLGESTITVNDELVSLDKIIELVTQNYQEQIDALKEDTTKETDTEIAKVQQRLQALGEDRLKTVEVNKLIAGGSTPDEANAIYDFMQKEKEIRDLFSKLGDTVIEVNGQLITEAELLAENEYQYQKNIESLQDTRTVFEQWADSMKSIGVADSFTSGIQGSDVYSIVQSGYSGYEENGGLGAAIGILTEILSKLEAFEQALNILQPFLELMDRFLAPLLPAINAIAQVIVTIVTGILTPLFPIIKTVATLIITICTVVESIYYAITFQWGKIGKIWDDYRESMRTIENMSLDVSEINQNTQKEDSALYKAYADMYKKNFINAEEFSALIAGLNGVQYDRVKAYESKSYNSVYYNNSYLTQRPVETVYRLEISENDGIFQRTVASAVNVQLQKQANQNW